MPSKQTQTIRKANSEELLLMSLFGSIQVRRAIARELERRASLNETVETQRETAETVAA